MTKRLFIAEKPSMGKAIATEISTLSGIAPKTDRAYISIGTDTVSWCFGHLLELAPPQAYDSKYEKWNLDNLPILPTQWKMQIAKEKKTQVDVIKHLLKDCDEVIHAGDPGREGQLIVDELLQFLNNKKPVKRILLNALDSRSIQQALNTLELNQKFLPMFFAGQARSHADWNVGMNMTRAFTILGQRAGYGDGVLSIGRVQTPTLSIIVQRDELIETFKPKDYWIPWATFKVAQGQFKAKWRPPHELEVSWLDDEKRIIQQYAAQTILDKVKGKTGIISKFEEKHKSIEPPLPFNLSILQTLANAKWSITAIDTLKICQELYEAKLISYPRTDCSYLPTNQLTYVEDILKAIAANKQELVEIILKADKTKISRAWNDNKLSEHHAIIPTRSVATSTLANLSDMHQRLYDAIAKRYIAQFYPCCDVLVTSVDVTIENEIFHATGQRQLNAGWKNIYADVDEVEEDQTIEENIVFPLISQGEHSICIDTYLKTAKTTPPTRLNDGTLIKAMTNVHQLVDDEKIKNRLKAVKGIGTEATRATILETLVARGFVKRDKKALISTPIGRALVHTLPVQMRDPSLTAMWENAFDDIALSENSEQAEARYHMFMNKINVWLKQLLTSAAELDFSELTAIAKKRIDMLPGHGIVCTSCGKGKMVTRVVKSGKAKGKKFLGCSNYPTCTHSEWPKY